MAQTPQKEEEDGLGWLRQAQLDAEVALENAMQAKQQAEQKLKQAAEARAKERQAEVAPRPQPTPVRSLDGDFKKCQTIELQTPPQVAAAMPESDRPEWKSLLNRSETPESLEGAGGGSPLDPRLPDTQNKNEENRKSLDDVIPSGGNVQQPEKSEPHEGGKEAVEGVGLAVAAPDAEAKKRARARYVRFYRSITENKKTPPEVKRVGSAALKSSLVLRFWAHCFNARFLNEDYC